MSDVVREETTPVLRQLARMDRRPFRKMLAELLECAPDRASVEEFARKYPDRWAQAVSIAAGLAGYERGVVVNIGYVNVEKMSDAELLAHEKRLAGALAGGARGDGPTIIDVPVEEGEAGADRGPLSPAPLDTVAAVAPPAAEVAGG